MHMSNQFILDFSLAHKEPLVDDYYIKDGELIIGPMGHVDESSLIRAHADLCEAITQYMRALTDDDFLLKRDSLARVIDLVLMDGMHFSEFVSFWSIFDISHSAFRRMHHAEQKELLEMLLEQYINMRHRIYLDIGYSPVALQAAKDAKSHKRSGSIAVRKVSKLLDEFGYVDSHDETVDDFLSGGDKKYINTDKEGKVLFLDLISKLKLQFQWSEDRERKMPDFLVKHRLDLYIVEHKHVKESGGGQDKQMTEIISLIGHTEDSDHIHYVAFLDGPYFNQLIVEEERLSRKIYRQLHNIQVNLEKNPRNYFVNTEGFKQLLRGMNSEVVEP